MSRGGPLAQAVPALSSRLVIAVADLWVAVVDRRPTDALNHLLDAVAKSSPYAERPVACSSRRVGLYEAATRAILMQILRPPLQLPRMFRCRPVPGTLCGNTEGLTVCFVLAFGLHPMFIIRGRRAAVTGAASGIGRAIALALAAEGADLFLIDRNGERLAGVVREAVAPGIDVQSALCDLAVLGMRGRATQISKRICFPDRIGQAILRPVSVVLPYLRC
jgi:short subunit dehydrogenase